MERSGNFDVVIIGGGTAGVAAAYAFAMKESNCKVALVERESNLGGTAVNSFVYDWIQGINPVYFEEICKSMGSEETCMIRRVKDGTDCLVPYANANDIKYTWVARQFYMDGTTNTDDGHIFFDPVALSKKYESDLEKKITLFKNYTFQKATSTDNENIKKVLAVVISNGEDVLTLSAKFFIDCSADGVLCRSVNNDEGSDFFIGIDSHDRFTENGAGVESLLDPMDNDYSSDKKKGLIEPSLFFLIHKNLNNATVNSKGSDVKVDGYPFPYVGDSKMTCNPMTGLGITGEECIDELGDIKNLKNKFVNRIQDYWHLMQTSKVQKINKDGVAAEGSTWAANYGISDPVECANVPGIRETYRIACKYMLTQNDLTIDVFNAIGTNADKGFIAAGSHGIDLHNVYGIKGDLLERQNAIKQFNFEQLKPYGIPYDCLVPVKLSNVWIACRAFGASHLAFSSARVNKVMAQLGWAAGNAARYCLSKNISDTDLNVADITELQGENYTAFKCQLDKAYSAIYGEKEERT